MSANKAAQEDKHSSNRRSNRPPHPQSIASLGKRSRGYSYDNSSDGPYFSSDDLAEACLENYASPRTKKQHRRTWWETNLGETASNNEQQFPTKVKEQRAEKPKDSGIFMASDSSSSNDDGFSLGVLSTRNLKRHSKRLGAFDDIQHKVASKSSHRVDPIAYQIIEACLEADKEDIDLSRCSLTTLSNETFRPLRNMIRRPKIDRQYHHVEEAFQSFNPRMKIFLASNLLRLIPAEILNLEHLTVLSLRNNKLSELPHSFGRLKNLVELNVAGNRLTWLPWEIVQLCAEGSLQNLHAFPNPLYRPYASSEAFGNDQDPQKLPSNAFDNFINVIESRIDKLSSSPETEVLGERLAWKSLEERHFLSRIWSLHRRRGGRINIQDESRDGETSQPVFLGSSAIGFLNKEGTPILSDAPSQLSRDSIVPLAPSHSTESFSSSGCNRVPSLFELALMTSSNSLIFTDIDSDLPEHTPDHVVRHLETARTASEVGATACSVCSKPFIVARAEWVEYWQCTGQQAPFHELWLPFLRRTCSWGCAESVVVDRISRLESDRVSFEKAHARVEAAKSAFASGNLQDVLALTNNTR